MIPDDEYVKEGKYLKGGEDAASPRRVGGNGQLRWLAGMMSSRGCGNAGTEWDFYKNKKEVHGGFCSFFEIMLFTHSDKKKNKSCQRSTYQKRANGEISILKRYT